MTFRRLRGLYYWCILKEALVQFYACTCAYNYARTCAYKYACTRAYKIATTRDETFWGG